MRGLAAVALALVATAGRPAAALNDPFPAEVIMPDGMGMLYAEVATFGPLVRARGTAAEPAAARPTSPGPRGRAPTRAAPRDWECG